MTRKEIVEKLSQTEGLTKSKTDSFIGAFTSLVMDSLAAGEDVVIKGFGRFTVKATKSKKGYNFQNGKTIEIESRSIPVFRFSKEFRKSGIDRTDNQSTN